MQMLKLVYEKLKVNYGLASGAAVYYLILYTLRQNGGSWFMHPAPVQEYSYDLSTLSVHKRI